MLSAKTSVLAKPSRASAVRPIAATATSTAAKQAMKDLKPLNVTKNNLLDSQGGETTRNIDGVVYYINYNKEKDEIVVVDKQMGLRFPAVVDESNRIRIDPTAGIPHAVPGFSPAVFGPVLQASSMGAEISNGRTAMVAFFGLSLVELISGQTVLQQAAGGGLVVAAVLGAAVLAASVAPAVAGKVPARKVFPDENDSFADAPLPYTWNALAEKLNGRLAMIAVSGMIIGEAVKGVATFPHLF